jgi:hypothetical protein
MVLIDLKKAYDSVERAKLMRVLEGRVKTKQDEACVGLIKSLLRNT